MAIYYIGADVDNKMVELAIEKNAKIIDRYRVPTTIPAIREVLGSIAHKIAKLQNHKISNTKDLKKLQKPMNVLNIRLKLDSLSSDVDLAAVMSGDKCLNLCHFC